MDLRCKTNKLENLENIFPLNRGCFRGNILNTNKANQPIT